MLDCIHLPGQVTPPDRAPDAFDLAKQDNEKSTTAPPISATPSLSSTATPSVVAEVLEQVSAADYDPSMDRREDDARQARHAAAALVDGTGEIPNQPEITIEDLAGDDAEETEEEEDDLDDMFAIDTSKPKKTKTSTTKVKIKRQRLLLRSVLLICAV